MGRGLLEGQRAAGPRHTLPSQPHRPRPSASSPTPHPPEELLDPQAGQGEAGLRCEGSGRGTLRVRVPGVASGPRANGRRRRACVRLETPLHIRAHSAPCEADPGPRWAEGRTGSWHSMCKGPGVRVHPCCHPSNRLCTHPPIISHVCVHPSVI